MSDAIKIYHNPRCSKSRETLELLKSNGVDPEVVLYLETPADAATLRELLQMLGMSSARELMRQKEDLYKSLNLADKNLSEDALIQAMVGKPETDGAPDRSCQRSGSNWTPAGAGTGNRRLTETCRSHLAAALTASEFLLRTEWSAYAGR